MVLDEPRRGEGIELRQTSKQKFTGALSDRWGLDSPLNRLLTALYAHNEVLRGRRVGLIANPTAVDAEPAAEVSAVPRIADERRSSRLLTVGDSIPEPLLETAMHILRIDPVLYWEPLARWAIRSNSRRL